MTRNHGIYAHGPRCTCRWCVDGQHQPPAATDAPKVRPLTVVDAVRLEAEVAVLRGDVERLQLESDAHRQTAAQLRDELKTCSQERAVARGLARAQERRADSVEAQLGDVIDERDQLRAKLAEQTEIAARLRAEVEPLRVAARSAYDAFMAATIDATCTDGGR